MGRHRLPAQLLILATAGLSLLLVAGFFGSVHPALDSLSHFRNQLAMLVALLALVMLAARLPLTGLPALGLAAFAFVSTGALNSVGIWPVKAGFEPRGEDRPVYRLLQINARYNNPTPEKVLSLIGRTKPDVVTLDEVSAMWKGKLDLLAASYPYRIVCPFPNGVFGVALLSRRPFAEGGEPRCYDRGAMAVAKVDFSGTAVDVAAIHLAWPWPFEQSWQIGNLRAPLGGLASTAIMAGDCNATPWSAAVRRVAKAGGLTLMPSAGPTWLYRKLPDFLRFAGLPIDQVFSKGDIRIHSAARMEDIGSDHLPILVEFSITPKPGGRHEEKSSMAAALYTTGRAPV
jgi:endonuclease/exonuclease/phosphatase (EEP) superfamily protein YafD